MKVCYSCLFSDYEEVKPPKVITPGWQYIMFADQPITSDIWEIRQVKDVETFGAQLLARFYKIMEWVDWEYSIWLDASFQIDVNLDDWWNKHFKGGLTAPAHPLRNDVYSECLDCISAQRGNAEQIRAQMDEYRKLGIPANNGLIQSGILMRENTPAVIELCESWWKELSTHSIRDQIAFAKVSINSTCVNTFQFDYRARKDFLYFHHFQRRGGKHIPMI